MIKKICYTVLILMLTLQAQAFEEYIIAADGKLTDISIENNKIVDVFPIVTIFNEKNMLMVHPLQKGETKFSVVKNGKQKFEFNVCVEDDRTKVEGSDKFLILSLDLPPMGDLSLDMPPEKKSGGK